MIVDKVDESSLLKNLGTSLVNQWLRLSASNARGSGLILGGRTRPHIPQLMIPRACKLQLQEPA